MATLGLIALILYALMADITCYLTYLSCDDDSPGRQLFWALLLGSFWPIPLAALIVICAITLRKK